MTNKQKASAGVGAAVVVAGALLVQEKHQFDYSKWGGMAEASQQAILGWTEGTNRYECLFEFNPDKVVAVTNIEDRVFEKRSFEYRQFGESLVKHPFTIYETNQVEVVTEYNPGICLVFRNGERIGTNTPVNFRPVMELSELRLLAADALAYESK
jgi:hypothetical protein